MSDEQPVEFFVARDRARRYARRIGDAFRERRLAYKGSDVGMATLVDQADKDLASVEQDAAATEAGVLSGTLRDRERGYMEIPLLSMTDGLLWRIGLARQLERARTVGDVTEEVARKGVLTLLEDALRRIDRYCSLYDDKRPIGLESLVDMVRLLTGIEGDALFARHLAGAGASQGRPYDAPPPPLRSEPDVLEDLLRALRATLPPSTPGPWRISAGEREGALVLSLGRCEGEPIDVMPTPVERAATILSVMHPVSIRFFGSQQSTPEGGGLLSTPATSITEGIDGFEVRLADRDADDLDRLLNEAAGPAARLTVPAEKAVRTLLEASPLTPAGLPPQRIVALMGVMKTFDEALLRTVLPRANDSRVRFRAGQVPRDKTRKAPVRKDYKEAVERMFSDFPVHRLDEVAEQTEAGKLARKHANAADVACLLVTTAHRWRFGGEDIKPVLPLQPLTHDDVEAMIHDLVRIHQVRGPLEAGKEVAGDDIAAFERALIAMLGRLGRLADA